MNRNKNKFLTRYGNENHIRIGLDTQYPQLTAAGDNPVAKPEHFIPHLSDQMTVRAAAAAMDSCGFEIPYAKVQHHFLASRTDDESTHIQSVLLRKKIDIPPDVLERMHCSAQPIVRMAALEHKSTTPEQFHRAANFDDSDTVRRVARNRLAGQ